jgi:hypothetical protein
MCESLKIPGREGVVIVCGTRSKPRFCVCGRAGEFLCDWKLKEKRKTCDRPICAQHALEVAPGKHLCREHQRAYQEWKKRFGDSGPRGLVRSDPEQTSLLA